MSDREQMNSMVLSGKQGSGRVEKKRGDGSGMYSYLGHFRKISHVFW